MTSQVLKTLFEEAGFAAFETDLLQPAEPFLDAAGEAFRKRLFITLSASGESLCLRPEFTIPVCRAYSQGVERYHYEGTVFRQQSDGHKHRPQEFRQAGVEALGEEDAARADSEMVKLALEALGALTDIKPMVVMGDPSFFQTLVKPMGLPDIWVDRLLRAFGDPDLVTHVLERMVCPQKVETNGFNGEDPDALTAQIAAMMNDHGMIGVGGRSAEDIAERFLHKIKEQVAVPSESAELCQLFLALQCDGGRVGETMTRFGKQHNVDFSDAINAYEKRFDGLQDVTSPITFSAGFGRRVDYYTGFVFEIFDRKNPAAGPLAGGGRYDRLSDMLGGSDVPAVGFALWLDRIGA